MVGRVAAGPDQRGNRAPLRGWRFLGWHGGAVRRVRRRALWAIAVALGVGFLFTAAPARAAMGLVSIALLLALAFLFLRGSWRASARGERPRPELTLRQNSPLLAAAFASAPDGAHEPMERRLLARGDG